MIDNLTQKAGILEPHVPKVGGISSTRTRDRGSRDALEGGPVDGDGESPLDNQPAHDKPSLDRSLLPGVMLSFVVHLVLAIVLALLTFSEAGGLDGHSFTMSDIAIEEIEFEEIEAFEIEPVAVEPPQFEVIEPQVANLSEQTLPELSSLTTTSKAESQVKASEIQNDSGDALEGLAPTAASIQSRVSMAGGKQGEVQFALAWRDRNDVDLHVIAPSGERISHMHKKSGCRGALDVDMNVSGESKTPVENVRWIRNAPSGRYTVLVNLFRVYERRGRRGSSFQLLSKLGDETEVKKNQVMTGDQVRVVRYTYVPQNLPEAQRERAFRELEALQAREEAAAEPILKIALEAPNKRAQDRVLQQLISTYPHTDVAIRAMRMLGGNIRK